jgi:small subunit ribosomal protein S3
VNTAKPGILIGRKGEAVKVLRKDLEDLTGKKIDLEIKEIKNPDCDAYLIAEKSLLKSRDVSAIGVP